MNSYGIAEYDDYVQLWHSLYFLLLPVSYFVLINDEIQLLYIVRSMKIVRDHCLYNANLVDKHIVREVNGTCPTPSLSDKAWAIPQSV